MAEAPTLFVCHGDDGGRELGIGEGTRLCRLTPAAAFKPVS